MHPEGLLLHGVFTPPKGLAKHTVLPRAVSLDFTGLRVYSVPIYDDV